MFWEYKLARLFINIQLSTDWVDHN
jgi:hypothetical protein